MSDLFATDAAGRRRRLGPNDVLRDGERLSVPLTIMDGRDGAVPALARLFLDGSGYETAGKSDLELMTAVVERRIGPAAVTGRSPEHIRAAFDTLVALSQPGRTSAAPTQMTDARAAAEAARDEMIRGLNDGWQKPVPNATAASHTDSAPTQYATAADAHAAYVKRLQDGV